LTENAGPEFDGREILMDQVSSHEIAGHGNDGHEIGEQNWEGGCAPPRPEP